MRPKTKSEIEAMRAGGKILASILDILSKSVYAGMPSSELSEIARNELKKHGATSAFLGYEGYPDVLCISVNQEVVHGIPGTKKVIKEGDLVSIDLGVNYKGMIVDSATTVFVGKSPKPEIKRLMEGTKLSLDAGINAIRGQGTRVGDIGAAVQKVLDEYKLGVIRDLVGHGVGHSVHEDPNIPNYGSKGTGPVLETGMTIAIEPMATLGGWRVGTLQDGWTIVTADNSLACHFEHTVLITEDGCEILTQL